MIFAGLIGAIVWNLITWLLRAAVVVESRAVRRTDRRGHRRRRHCRPSTSAWCVSKVLLPAVLAPLIAGRVAFAATRLAYAITRPQRERDGFTVGQIFTSSLVSLAHGTNDAQKTMGVITLTLIAAGFLDVGAHPPFW